MNEEKRKRLDSIKDEVADFHPLLKVLLPKMPNVQCVEYTHGPHEMGADFLLSRLDSTFGQSDYIAVVAKVGKIDQASVSEIDRQIDESFVPKLFNGGKDRVNVSEVWVMTNAGISHGAKERINDKYRGRKINFIPGDKLGKFIDDYAQNYWTDVPLQIGDYLNQLRQQNDELDRSMSLAKNSADVYVEQDIYTVPEREWEAFSDARKKPHKVDIIHLIQREKAILIEGEMGAGKSKLLRRIIRHYTLPEHFIDTGIVPVFITYKNLIDNYGGDLNKVVGEYVNKGVLAELDEKAVFLFLVDGVDEKNLGLEEQLTRLSALIGRVNETAQFKAVITSRHLGSIEQNRDVLKRAMRLEVHPLSTHRLIEFVQKLCSASNISKRIFEDMKKSHLFKELPRSPIAAILLANLLQENAKEMPSNMTELYSKYVELVLGRWDIEKGLQTQKEYEALDSVLMRISRFVIENEIHYLAIDEAKGIIDEYLKPRNLGIQTERLFSILTERTGIIMVDHKEKRICFKHRTFAEYFYAKQKLRDHDFVVDNRAFHFYWLNVCFFFVGLIKDCPELLEAISDLEAKTPAERLIKMVNMGNYFMAGFASPYEVVESGLTKVITDAAIHYSEILNKKIESPLSNLSEMHLLCLFQMILRDSYAYEFFGKAVETAFLEIDYCGLDASTKAYALFFLNVIYNDIQDKEVFDKILERYAKELPLSVQLAIRHEGEGVKQKSGLLKRHEKALKKSIRGNKSLQDQLQNMYDRPIRALKLKIT